MGDDLRRAHERLTARVIDRQGVRAVSVGIHGGKPCLKVHVSGREAARDIPKSVDGVKVVTEVSGPFRRQDAPD